VHLNIVLETLDKKIQISVKNQEKEKFQLSHDLTSIIVHVKCITNDV